MEICHFPQQDILETSHKPVGLNVADADVGISENLTWERKSFQMENMFAVFTDSKLFWALTKSFFWKHFYVRWLSSASAKCFEFQTPYFERQSITLLHVKKSERKIGCFQLFWRSFKLNL